MPWGPWTIRRCSDFLGKSRNGEARLRHADQSALAISHAFLLRGHNPSRSKGERSVAQPTENAIMTGEEALSRLLTATEPGIPLFVSVTLTIRPERLEAFTVALTDVLPRARAEDSCVHLDVGRMVVDPAVFVLWERWRDLVEYRDVVLQKDYFQEYLRISEDAYARPRVVTLLEPFVTTSS